MSTIGIVKGIKNIKAHVDAEEEKFSNRGNSAKWFKIKDKQAVKVLFLQELDESAKNYSVKNGVGFLAVEHSNPANYLRKAICSLEDEGVCWACEQHSKDYKAGWKQKSRLYINVLVDNTIDDPYVAVLSQGNGNQSVTLSVIEIAGDAETITDKWFKIKRTGSERTDTSYLLTQLGEHEEDVEAYELFDLDKVVRKVPYAEQQAHYLGTQQSAEPRELATSGASNAANAEW